MTTPSAAERRAAVLADIEVHAKRNDRSADDIALMAVSKTQPAEAIISVLKAGHRLFGENRVQEAEDKWPDLKSHWPDAKVALIGPLQSNKARVAIHLFDRIDSVDRMKIAKTLARVMAEEDCHRPVLIQVNTGNEPQKSGIAPEEADSFIATCRDTLGLAVEGLQCIPPLDDHPAPHFALLAKIAKRNGLSTLSMGMSGDYPTAIAMGATIVRLGTAVFGPRQQR